MAAVAHSHRLKERQFRNRMFFCSCVSCVKRRMRWRGWDAVGCKTNKTHAQNTLPQFLQWCLRSTRLNFTRHSLHLQSPSTHQRQKKTQFTKFRPSGRKRGGKRTLRPRNRASSEWSDQFQGVPTGEQRSNFGMCYTIPNCNPVRHSIT